MVTSNSMREALRLCRNSIIAVGVFSLVINFLMLTPLFYMLNVFDKAVANQSFPTLISLAAIALFLYVLLAIFEWLRSAVLVHIANRLDYSLAPQLYDLCFKSESGLIMAQNVGSQPLSDLNALRQFLGSPSASVIFDLPWTPILLILMLLFHPLLAGVATVSICIMAAIAIANQRGTSAALLEANRKSRAITQQTELNLRNAEAASAMGMMTSLTRRWRGNQVEMLSVQTAGSTKASAYQAVIKTLTMLMQSVAITTGAILVIRQEISPGVMIVAALLLGKCLQPIQQGVSGWKSFLEAREQYRRLNDILSAFPQKPTGMPLPKLTGSVICRKALVVPPGGDKPTLADVDLDFLPGTTTVILGPSGAGKSTLIRAILGIWPTSQGEVRIDGATASSYARDQLGPQIGYLPQAIELFDGTIAENIARFGDVDPDAVYAAAEDAGVKDLILALPDGFDTAVTGRKQGLLSPGQRQRIALARAVYKRPKILVLDEPNSNLDAAGEQCLGKCIEAMKNQGSTIIVVSHRPSVMPFADYVAIINNGRIQGQGTKEQMLARIQHAKPAGESAHTLAEVSKEPGKL